MAVAKFLMISSLRPHGALQMNCGPKKLFFSSLKKILMQAGGAVNIDSDGI